mmetsp:Transcript_4161/g.9763  ORF Transcript_4161/g.9763 Transcript_4161/m.9763 type:complete len:660 (-) Transcript_4161:109-2088(-)
MVISSAEGLSSASSTANDGQSDSNQQRDNNQLWDQFAPLRLFGPDKAFIFFTAFVIFGTALVACIIGHALIGGPKSRRMNRIANAVDSLTLVWIMMFGLSATICCIDIYDAQKLWARSDNGDTFRGTQAFRTGEWFYIGAATGLFSATMLIATGFFKLCSPEGRNTPLMKALSIKERYSDNQTKGGKKVTNPRNHSFYHLAYIATIGFIISTFISPANMTREVVQQVGIQLLSSFAVPALVFVDGYSAPAESKEISAKSRSVLLKYCVCYFFMTMLYVLFFEYIIRRQLESKYSVSEAYNWMDRLTMSGEKHKRLDLDVLYKWLISGPWWHLWYLQSLILWRMLIPVWMTFRLPITGSLAAAICAMYMTPAHFDSPFGIARSLEYFPWFVIGATVRLYGYSKPLMAFAKLSYTKMAAGTVLLFFVGFTLASPFNALHDMGLFVIPGASVEVKFQDRQRWYPIGKVAYMLLSGSVICSLISLLPNEKTYFSRAAKNSLVPFVCHYAVFLAFIAWGMYGTAVINPLTTVTSPETWRQVVYVVGAISVGNFFFIPRVARVLKFIIFPPMDWIFRRDLSMEISDENNLKAKLQTGEILFPDDSLHAVKAQARAYVKSTNAIVNFDEHEEDVGDEAPLLGEMHRRSKHKIWIQRRPRSDKKDRK